MKPRLNYRALQQLPSATELDRAIADVLPPDPRLSEVVRLHALLLARMKADVEDGVEIPAPVQDRCDRMLQDHPIALPPSRVATGGDCRHLTLLCPYQRPGSHLFAVAIFVAFLLSMERFARISVVFTAELDPKLWNPDRRAAHHQAVLEVMQRAVAEFHGTVPAGLLEKLRIVVSPEAPDLADAIGDVVVRYEGSVPRNQVRLGIHSLYAQRPVIVTVGNSIVRHPPAADLLMSPSRRERLANEVRFLRPLPRFPHRRVETAPKGAPKRLLSGYTKDKLERGFQRFGDDDWTALADLFRKDASLVWHLFGANDTDAVWRAIPDRFPADLRDRFRIDERIDLTHAFEGGYAYVALPGAGGGASTARMALRHGIPILVCRDEMRDISNAFPTAPEATAFTELLQQLADWATAPEQRQALLTRQIADINQRADLPEKIREFNGIVSDVIERFRRRQGGGILA